MISARDVTAARRVNSQVAVDYANAQLLCVDVQSRSAARIATVDHSGVTQRASDGPNHIIKSTSTHYGYIAPTHYVC